MKEKGTPLSHKPFKKAHKYETIEDAKADAAPGEKISDSHAQARMDAQDVDKQVKEENLTEQKDGQ